jgi:serine/threonine protein kinase
MSQNGVFLQFLNKTRKIAGKTRKITAVYDKSLSRERFAKDALATGQPLVLDHYRVHQKLGQGSMGIVYEAWDTIAEKWVALKIMKFGFPRSEHDLHRFRKEAESIAKLNHPGIVRFYSWGSIEGTHYYTMDLVEGWTLDAWVNRTNPSVNRCISTFRKVVQAIEYAHQNGVIHRDLKPGNIMVTENHEPQVMDFGLAHDESKPISLTVAGTLLGTPFYMSPEQAEARMSDIGPHSDVWSLGVILYEALTGYLPFTGRNIYEVLYSLLHGDPISPRRINSHIPRSVEAVILKCLEKNSNHRYSKAAFLEEDLQACLEKRPISIQTRGFFQTIRKKFQRKKRVSFEAFSVEREARRKAESTREQLEKKVERELRREWSVVFEDDFSDPNVESRWEVLGGNWIVKDGTIGLQGGYPQVMYLKQAAAGDVRLECICHSEEEAAGELSCFLSAVPTVPHIQSCNTGYMFQYGALSSGRLLLARNDRFVLERTGEHVVGKKTYHLRAERSGARLSFWVNQQLQYEWTDPEPLDGYERSLVGLYFWRSNICIHQVRVSQLSTPLKEDLLDVGQRLLARHHYQAAKDLFTEVKTFATEPERIDRARKGIEHVTKIIQLSEQLPKIREDLSQYWRDPLVQLNKDRLLVRISGGNLGHLKPLEKLPISELHCSITGTTDLEALKAMPLKVLNANKNQIQEADALQEAPLESLQLSGNRLTRIDFLKGLPLNTLTVDANNIEDLTPLKGLSITNLRISRNPIKDLKALEGLPLTELRVERTLIETLDGLQGTNLRTLSCMSNQITDLSPLEGLPLSELYANDNPLRSIAPFHQKCITKFCFDDEFIPVSELEEMSEVYSQKPQFSDTARMIQALLAFRRHDVEKLKSIAIPIGKRRYLYISRRLSYAAAESACKEFGGNLATYDNGFEARILRGFQNVGPSDAWIGLKVIQGKPQWVNGNPYRPVFGDRWAKDILSDGGVLWNRGLCRSNLVATEKRAFFIEWQD